MDMVFSKVVIEVQLVAPLVIVPNCTDFKKCDPYFFLVTAC